VCNVSTSLIANGAWATAAWLQAGLFGAKFSGEIDRKNPPNALTGSYRTSDNRWLLLAFVEEDKNWPVFAQAIGRDDLLKDPRFIDSKSRHANSGALVAELDRFIGDHTLEDWKKLLDGARLPYGVVQIPEEIVNDPQLLANQIIVPIDDGSANPKYTVSSPLTVGGVAKVASKPAPGLGEHGDQVLAELGFDATEIDNLRASGAIPHAWRLEAAATGGAK
jgi:crotonobetainyl-CoA:carnitine CoA-transferase CaiB-like acyl-CoA transferase